VELAARGAREDVIGRTHARLAAAGALKRALGDAPPGSADPATAER
jgi:hypothetical protein